MNTNSEQNLFRDTINDIKSCLAIGKSIFLMVVINKVEDKDDDEVQAMINQCRNNVNKIINELCANQIKYGFSIISAMNCLYYRLFMRNYTFDNMEIKDITRLAEMELGRSGRDFVKNPSDRIRLAELIKANLNNDITKSKWQNDCGINDMTNFINVTILSETALIEISNGQRNVVLNKFQKDLVQPNITWEIGLNLIKNYISFYKQTKRYLSLFETTFIREVIAKCFYSNVQINLIELIRSIYMISELDLPECKNLFLNWKTLISDTILRLYINLWYGARIENNKSFINYSGNGHAHLTGTGVNFASNAHDHLPEHYKNCVDLTFQLSQLDELIYSNINLLNDIIIPIIVELRKSPVQLYFDLLTSIEDRFLYIAVTLKNAFILQQFCKQLLRSKIYHRDFIPGYGLLLKEISNSNIKFRETYYFSIVPVLYQVSEVDKNWAIQMETSEKSYQDVLVNHKYFKSEKYLLQR